MSDKHDDGDRRIHISIATPTRDLGVFLGWIADSPRRIMARCFAKIRARDTGLVLKSIITLSTYDPDRRQILVYVEEAAGDFASRRLNALVSTACAHGHTWDVGTAAEEFGMVIDPDELLEASAGLQHIVSEKESHLREQAIKSGAAKQLVTRDGYTKLPEQLLEELGLRERGGYVWFLRGADRWEAWKTEELDRALGLPGAAEGKEP